jgi:hypothetical protein
MDRARLVAEKVLAFTVIWGTIMLVAYDGIVAVFRVL